MPPYKTRRLVKGKPGSPPRKVLNKNKKKAKVKKKVTKKNWRPWPSGTRSRVE